MTTTRSISIDDVPVIDIGGLRDRSDSRGVGEALARAATEVGFLYVTNHGVAAELIDGARTGGLEFFRLPDEHKLAAATNEHHHGYLRPGSTRMHDDAKVDLKESFNWGIELGAEVLAAVSANPLLGPNPWPPAMPSLKSSVYEYFVAASACAEDLLRGFALGAGVDAEYFIRARDLPVSRGSLQYYPPQPEPGAELRFGVAAHTDFGVLTVLCQDSVGGLQLQRMDGEWVAVPPVEGSFVVNVGDLLERWTNGRFRSTPHRVINSSGRERLSLVLAYDPNFETVIDPSELCRDGEVPRDEPITCGDYLLWRFEKAFSYRQS